MTNINLYRRAGVAMLVLALAGAANVSGARRARAQAKPIKIGTASALADHAEVDLKGRFMLLSGSVRVKMPGQVDEKETIVTADSMRLAMGTNPVTKKPDLAAITADGHVHFNASQTVPNKDGKPMQRTIDGSSDKAVLHRFEQRAELTGNVTVTSDDAEQKVTSSGAGSATVDLKAGTVAAHKAEGGPQVSIQWESKVPAAPKKAK